MQPVGEKFRDPRDLAEEIEGGNRVLAAINSAQAGFIASRPLEEIFGDILVSLITLTDSEAGSVRVRGSVLVEDGTCEDPWVVTLASGGEELGIVELSGRVGGYDQETRIFVEPLIKTSANLLRAHRGDQARAEAEEALAQALEVARDAGRVKSAVLSRMSHELRTPLNAIIGFSQLLELEELDPSAQEGVAEILTAGRHLLGLVDEVLDIAEVTTADVGAVTEVDLLEVVLSTVATLDDADAGGDRVVITGQGRGVADPVLLGRVLKEVIENALRFSDKDVAITVARGTIVVSDKGKGMSEGQLERLGEPFERRSDLATPGLGMTLVQRATAAMGTRVEVDSRRGSGTSVKLVTADAPG